MLAAASVFLVSVYKPLIVFATVVPWAWLVSSKLEKDARYYKLKHRLFNYVYLGCFAAALAAMLFVPIFWIGWPLGIAVLAAPLVAYMKIRNAEVPEGKEFKLTGQGLAERLAARRAARAHRAALLAFLDAEGRERPTPSKDDPRFTTHMLVEDLVVPALAARASQVDIAVGSGGATVSHTIDGIRYKRQEITAEQGMGLIDYLKDVAGLNVEDRRRRQNATFRMNGPAGRNELSLVTAGSSSGVELRIVFDRAKRLMVPFDNLGLLPQQLEAMRVIEEPHERHGIVVFAAPPGQGLSTTAYSLVGRHDAYTSNIKTLEREVLAEIDGVDHVQFDPSNKEIDFATNLQSILRRDPDVVLIGQPGDPDTARVATDPGIEGPLIYVPLRAAGTVEAVRTWAQLVGEVPRAAAALRVVMTQRLMRKVCENCRQAYPPTAEQLQKLNLPPDRVKQLYQAGGKIQVKNKIDTCPVCGGTGYFGQTGVFEVLVFDDEMRKLLAEGNLKGVLAQARRKKMIYLQEAALRKAVDGVTTIEEVIRVTAPPRKSQSPRRAEPKPVGQGAPPP